MDILIIEKVIKSRLIDSKRNKGQKIRLSLNKPLSRICKFAKGSLTNSSLSPLGRDSKFGFTLAEVLITLGIIGVVAAITMPTLIAHYQKQATVTKLKQAYSLLYNAVRMAEIDHGDVTEWDIPIVSNYESEAAWVKKYITPYLKSTEPEICESGRDACIYLANGTEIGFWAADSNAMIMHVFVTLSGTKNKLGGKNNFVFLIGNKHNDSYMYRNGKNPDMIKVRPYDFCSYPGVVSCDMEERTFWKTGCSASDPVQCAGLIMYDGWKIAPDYPIKF